MKNRPGGRVFPFDTASSSTIAGGSATREAASGQWPRSICRQRSLQNGRQRLSGANRLSPPQVGQGTMRGAGVAGMNRSGMTVRLSGTQGEFEGGVNGCRFQAPVLVLAHQ